MLFLVFSFLVIAIAAQSQSFESASVMRENTYASIGGTAADTLVASDSLEAVLRVYGDATRDINLGMKMTKTSGTVTNNFFISGSMDGAAFVDLDTIAYSNASSGTTFVRLDNFNFPYLRLRGIAGATAQKASYQLFYINRED